MKFIDIIKSKLKLRNKERVKFSSHTGMRDKYFLELKNFYLIKFRKTGDEFYLQKAKECEDMYNKCKKICEM